MSRSPPYFRDTVILFTVGDEYLYQINNLPLTEQPKTNRDELLLDLKKNPKQNLK
jgi:hypothetical protein